MEEKKCSACGKVTDNWKEWYHCKGCGTDYCPECHSGHFVDHVAEARHKRQEEKRKQAAMSRGDFETKKRLTCPRCDDHLTQMYF